MSQNKVQMVAELLKKNQMSFDYDETDGPCNFGNEQVYRSKITKVKFANDGDKLVLPENEDVLPFYKGCCKLAGCGQESDVYSRKLVAEYMKKNQY